MNISISKLSWMALCAALGAALGAFFLAGALDEKKNDLEAMITTSQKNHIRTAEEQKTIALLTMTESNREKFQSILAADLLSLADLLVAAGKDAGVILHVSNATPESNPVTGNSRTQLRVHAVKFTVDAEGPFDRLYKALTLLESLSAASVVENVTFGQEEKTWHMSARVRILTTSAISP